MGNVQHRLTEHDKRPLLSPTYTSVVPIKPTKFQHGPSNHIEWFIPPLPEEIYRLQTLHFLLHHIWQSNFSAPEMEERLLQGDARVLEIGCGPGTWTLEMASNYTSASFVGVDICPTFPSEIKPQNTSFIQANLTEGIPCPNDYFDFVYMRFSSVVLNKQQWNKAIQELVRIVKPGGVIEIMETDMHWYNEGPIARKLTNILTKDLNSRGIAFTTQQVPTLLKSHQSLEQVKQDERTCHFGKWAGRVGELYGENIIQMFRILKYRYASMLSLSEDEYEVLLSRLVDEFEKVKPFAKLYRFWARKATV